MKRSFLLLCAALTFSACAPVLNTGATLQGDRLVAEPATTNGVGVGTFAIRNGNAAPATRVVLYLRGGADFAPKPEEPCRPDAPGFVCVLPDIGAGMSAQVRYDGKLESAQLRYFVAGRPFLRAYYLPRR